jgi:hypothetical protein
MYQHSTEESIARLPHFAAYGSIVELRKFPIWCTARNSGCRLSVQQVEELNMAAVAALSSPDLMAHD